MKKVLTILTLALLFAFSTSAQLKIGAPAGAPNASAILDLNAGAANRGLLLPSVALTGTTSFAPLAANVPGMMVFNTATVSDVTPGIYYNDGTKWAALTSSNSFPPATFTGSTLTCAAAPSGTYQVGVAMTSSNTKQVSINTATAGTYTASTNAVNGVTFAATGTILSTGTTNITLNATGTPTASGPINYAVTLGGQNCNFSVTFAGAATFNCAGAVQVQNPAGPLTSNSTGTYTIPYTAGNGTAYGPTVLSNNGFTLTRASGTYAAGGGNVVYTLGYGSGSSTSAIFTTTECGAVTFGDAIKAQLTTSLNAYNLATPGQWVAVTSTEYANLANPINIANSGVYGLNEANLTSTSGSGNALGNYTTMANGPSILLAPASSYIYAVSYIGNYGSTTNNGIKIKYASGTSTPNGAVADYIPAFTVSGSAASGTRLYFVQRSPSATLPASPSTFFLGEYAQANFQIRLQSLGTSNNRYGVPNDVTTMGAVSASDNGVITIQFLGTVTKQW